MEIVFLKALRHLWTISHERVPKEWFGTIRYSWGPFQLHTKVTRKVD